MLPEATLAFTIPSLHDGLTLDCRVYHPASSRCPHRATRPPHAAVLAHPYAPMGGSYDDPILHSFAARLLKAKYLVGTFNFRGAGHSAGRTSWTAKAERGDFASVIGFMVHYGHFLNTGGASSPVLLVGGYSYGAMVTAQLAPLSEVLARFVCPVVDGAAAEIRLRAQHLAEQQRSQPSAPVTLRVGGGDGDRSPRGFSLDADEMRRGVHDLLARGRRTTTHHGPTLPRISLVRPREAYLLVSPLVGLVTRLATMWTRHGNGDETKLVTAPTLAVYGDGDVFVSVGKLRAWAARCSGVPGSLFASCEVAGAGHFWAEEGVLRAMVDRVGAFADGLVEEGEGDDGVG